MAVIGGLHGGLVDPGGQGTSGIRSPVGDGAPVSKSGVERHGITDGSLVDGLVTGKEGDMYQVKIGARTLNASSTVQLFVGQRFRALWDASSSPPMLRLRYADMTVLARFTGRDQNVAMALLIRGMPVNEEGVSELRRQWMKAGGDPAKLGALAELWARGAATTEANIELLAWYMGLTSEDVARLWKKIRDRLRTRKFRSPKELLAALQEEGDEEVKTFLKAHSLAGRPAKGGLDPASLLAPAWWPVGEGGEPVRARVAFSSESRDERRVWRTAFDFEGHSLGAVRGYVITNGKAMSANVSLEDERRAERVRKSLPALREELASIPLILQYLGVGTSVRDEDAPEERLSLDMEI